MDHLKPEDFVALTNPGVTSLQLLFPGNSAAARVTMTRVVIAPGNRNNRHSHASSEQIWYALAGEGVLLLADGKTQPFRAGELARFAANDVHGFENTSAAPFEYLSVTTPPIDFRPAYRDTATPGTRLDAISPKAKEGESGGR